MLRIYIRDESDDLSDIDNLVYDVERAFGELEIPTNDLIKQAIADIDHGKMIDSYSIIDRFGYKLRISEISTGAKAAILTILQPDKVINLWEVGLNCRDWIVLNVPNGQVMMRYPNISIAYPDSALEKKIDVEIDGHNKRFTGIEELVRYIRNEV